MDGSRRRSAILLIGLVFATSIPPCAFAGIPQPIVSFEPDGSFSFSYDTKTGGYQSQAKKTDGSVSGSYGFSGEGGSSLSVNYGTGGGGGASGAYMAPSAPDIPMSPSSYTGGSSSAGEGKGTMTLNLNPDGTYNYMFQLNDQSKSESREVGGKVEGKFSYKGKDGQEKSIAYIADEGGFQPTGAHIPKAEDIPQAPTLADFGISSPEVMMPMAPMAPVPLMAPMRSASSGTMNLNLQPGGIYSYDYTLNDQAKSESRDAQGKVKGKFSFKGKDGQEKSLTYTADEGGFQAMGAHLPKADEDIPTIAVGSTSGSAYAPSSGKGYATSSIGSPASSGVMTLSLKPGGIYTYDYTLTDQAKSESRNAAGDVVGQFSFTDPKGGKKAIKYKADKGGFQAEGDHIPKPPPEMAKALASLGVDVSAASSGAISSASSSSGSSGTGGSYNFNYDTGAQSHSQSGSGLISGSDTFSSSSYDNAKEDKGEPSEYPNVASNYAFSYNAPAHSRSESRTKRQAGSFTFNYDTGDHSHSQSGTASAGGEASSSSEGESPQAGQGQVQVQGKYAVNAPAGSSQSVSYTANGKAGYKPTVEANVALGNGAKSASALPNAVPAASPSEQAPEAYSGPDNSVQGKYEVNDPSGSKQSVTYTAGGKEGYKPTVAVSTNVGKMKRDVEGKYSVNDPNGHQQSVTYNAGGKAGYQATVAVSANVGKVKRDVEGKYTVNSKDSSQETTYKATKDGFMPVHSITITLGKP